MLLNINSVCEVSGCIDGQGIFDHVHWLMIVITHPCLSLCSFSTMSTDDIDTINTATIDDEEQNVNYAGNITKLTQAMNYIKVVVSHYRNKTLNI